MKKWIHSSYNYGEDESELIDDAMENIVVDGTRGETENVRLIREWYTPEYYPDVDPERIDDLKSIPNWGNVTAEDAEFILYDEEALPDLSAIKSIRYTTDDEDIDLMGEGYDGGYVVTYKDGSKKMFAWHQFGDDGKLYPIEASYFVERCDRINASEDADVEKSTCSFDFDAGDDTYSYDQMKSDLEDIFREQGLEVIGIDFRSVDYPDGVKSQGGIDFEWKGDYDSYAIQDAIDSYITDLGFDFLGIDFYSLD